MQIGILSLQGAVGPHRKILESLEVGVREVRKPEHLEDLAGVILPGGESSTMIHLLHRQGLWLPLRDFLQSRPGWGICAGAILMAQHVFRPEQDSLKLLDVEIERNAFGRQIDSFVGSVTPSQAWIDKDRGDGPLEAVFIRAPRIREVGNSVVTLFSLQSEPVLVESNHLMASTFHPELTTQDQLHRYFLEKCDGR